MIRKLLATSALLLLAAPASAAETEVDLGDIGPRWIGTNFQDNLGWNIQSIGDMNGERTDMPIAQGVLGSPLAEHLVLSIQGLQSMAARQGRLAGSLGCEGL